MSLLWWSFFLTLTVASKALAIPGIVPDGFDSGASVEHRGRYYNPNYCFSVVIPDGVVGKSDPPPSPHHGFGARLDSAGDSYLYVGADYGAEIDPPMTPDKVLRQRFPKSPKASAAQLGSLPAWRTVRHYNCADTTCVDDVTVAISEGRSFELRLVATADEYKAKKLESLEAAQAYWIEYVEQHEPKKTPYTERR